MSVSRRTVIIPGCINHAGHHAIGVTVAWTCPHCGGPRGEPQPRLSYDGSRRLQVHGWTNLCGHPDPYELVRVEAGITSCAGWPHG